MVSDSRAGAAMILALESDLFFAVKVTDILKRAGYGTRVARTADAFQELVRGGDFAAALVNASARGVDWQAGIAAARTAGIPVIAYASHVDVATQTAARVAGATRVIANSRLADLGAIVERLITSATGGADDARPT